MASNENASSFGSFIPTTYVWDVAALYSIDVNSDAFKELLVRLYQNINNIILSLNTRDAGYYVPQEFINGQVYFQNPALSSQTALSPVYRQVFRMVVNAGVLPNTGTTNIPHSIPINEGYSFTRIYGCASDPVGLTYIPIPYVSATGNVSLLVNSTDVVLTTTANFSAYTITYVVLEYLKT